MLDEFLTAIVHFLGHLVSNYRLKSRAAIAPIKQLRCVNTTTAWTPTSHCSFRKNKIHLGMTMLDRTPRIEFVRQAA